MIALVDIKNIVTPQGLAEYFLGQPSHQRGDTLWYCSPFRNEKHPSFKVDSVGMYDFGSDTNYDIFSFVMKFRNCSFKESVETLASIYGIADRDYDSKEITSWYKKQREEKARYERELHEIYLAIWDEVDKELKETCEYIEIFKGKKEYKEIYAVLLNRKLQAWSINGYLADEINTLEDKEELKQKVIKGELPIWLMDRLKIHTTILQTLLTKPQQKREY